MKRLRGVTPWLLVALCAVFVVLAATTPDLLDPWWRLVIVGIGAVLVLQGGYVNRIPLPFVVVMVLAAARLAVFPVTGGDSPAADLTWLPAGLDLGTGLALITILAIAIRQRCGAMNQSDLIDVLAIVIGGSIVTWLTVTNPLIDNHGVDIGLAIAFSAFLPVSVLIVTFTIDLMFTGLTHNRTMYLVVAGTIANLTATLIKSLRSVEVMPVGSLATSVAVYSIALLLMSAGLLHRDSRQVLRHSEGVPTSRHDSIARLTVMAVGLIAPVVAIGLIAPTSRLDSGVRATLTLALVLAIVVRLQIAMRDHAAARDALLHRVNRDDLTGLPTRTRFVEQVADLLESTWRSGRQPTIIQLNLDRFKNINDSLGHFDANLVLIEIAQRLRTAASEFGGIVARSGGDDFVIVDGSTTSTTDAMAGAESIRHALIQPITVADSTVFVTASFGVAITPRNRTISAEDLMRRADIATHRAKRDGRNRVALFDDSMQADLTHRMDVEHALHGAIGRREMQLYHQPIVDIVTGRVSGFEALMRWRRSDGEMVSPGAFIPIAEETGIICELGAWALNDALGELRDWIDLGVIAPTTTMSVNVSPRQIADPNFAEVVRDALKNSGVSPHLLWIEMTESMMLDEPELAQTTLRQIHAMGVRIALDDFGTGFSSLSLLQKFPISRIKIDRAFVRGIAEHSNDRSLVRTIIAMAQSMELDLVGEGVETVHQLQSLRELGCGKAQGFLISHPVPADAMRSTMVALDELKSLSLFGPVEDLQIAAIASFDQSLSRTERPSQPVGMATSGPIGGLSSRPLGSPHL